MKQFIEKLLKNKMACVLLIAYAVTMMSLIIGTFVDSFVVVTMFCFGISSIITAVQYFLIYRKAGISEEKEYLPLTEDEVKKINKNISTKKRDTILKIIMFLLFGIAFLVFGIRMCL